MIKEVPAGCKEYRLGFGDSAQDNDYFINQLTELLSTYGRVDEEWFDAANGEGRNGKKQVCDFNRWYAPIRKRQPAAVMAVMGPHVRRVGTESGYGREMEWCVVPIDAQVQKNIAANSQQEVGFAPGNRMADNFGSRLKAVSRRTDRPAAHVCLSCADVQF